MRKKSSTVAHRAGLILAGVLWVGCSSSGGAPPSDAPSPDSASERDTGVFSEAQAERGRAVFEESCTECHSSREFHDEEFKSKWSDRSVWNLFSTMWLNMPEDNPGGLPRERYTDVVAYILQLNGFDAGTIDLRSTEEVMRGISLGSDPADPEPAVESHPDGLRSERF